MSDRMEERFDMFIDNHWPHMVSRVGRLEGKTQMIIGFGLGSIALLSTILGVLLSGVGM